MRPYFRLICKEKQQMTVLRNQQLGSKSQQLIPSRNHLQVKCTYIAMPFYIRTPRECNHPRGRSSFTLHIFPKSLPSKCQSTTVCWPRHPDFFFFVGLNYTKPQIDNNCFCATIFNLELDAKCLLLILYLSS